MMRGDNGYSVIPFHDLQEAAVKRRAISFLHLWVDTHRLTHKHPVTFIQG